MLSTRMKYVIPIFLCVLGLSSAGCASDGISLENFGGRSDIPKGEKAEIYWSFKNADSVQVSGINKRFAPNDKIQLSPEKTTTYRIVGYTQKGDSLSQEWTVNVYSGAVPHDDSPKRVAITAPETFLHSSADSSALYLRDYHTSSSDKPIKPNIMRIVKSRISGDLHILRAVIVDDKGSFVKGYSKSTESFSDWKVHIGCDGTTKEVMVKDVSEFDAETYKGSVALSLCIDRSENMSGLMESTFESVRNFVSTLSPTDYINMLTFNQSLTQAIVHSDAAYARDFFTYVQTPITGGTSAVYRACSRGIANLEQVPDAETSKIVVLITGGADNGSLFMSGGDIASQANAAGVAVYVVSMDETSAEQYKLRYLTASTGGRYYALDKKDRHRLIEVLSEIVASQKAYYEIAVPKIENYVDKCASSTLTCSLSLPSQVLQDEYLLYPDAAWEQPATQMLVQFRKPNAEIEDEYSATLQLLAETLQKNPTKIIELLGHTDLSDKGDDATAIGLSRAQAVRRKLIKYGVNPDQLRTRSMANKKPVYMVEREERQVVMNRRVEVRWLDPSLLPYEIEVGNVQSEEDALRQTEQWEQRGLKAYYERIVVDKNPGYVVKLWGYATMDEANTSAKMLRKKYKTETVVH